MMSAMLQTAAMPPCRWNGRAIQKRAQVIGSRKSDEYKQRKKHRYKNKKTAGGTAWVMDRIYSHMFSPNLILPMPCPVRY